MGYDSTLKVAPLGSSETLVCLYQTRRLQIPEVHTQHLESPYDWSHSGTDIARFMDSPYRGHVDLQGVC